MREFTTNIGIRFDEEVNAALLRFGEIPSAHEIVDLPIMRGDDLVGVITFSTSGRLVDLELLDARTQIGQLLTDQ